MISIGKDCHPLHRTNCLAFALKLWKYSRHGDHLVMRKSHYGWFPHFKVLFEMPDGSIVTKEFVPIGPRRRFLPPPWFRGIEMTRMYKSWRDCPDCPSGPPSCERCK